MLACCRIETLGGRAAQPAGLNVADMFAARLKSYILLGGIEPALDIASPAALEALKAAEFVVALSPYRHGERVRARHPADRHVRGDVRHVRQSRRPLAERARCGDAGRRVAAGWKVLRVLGNLLNLSGFDYTSSDQITEEVRKQVEAAPAFALKASARTLQSKLALGAAAGEAMHRATYRSTQVDAMVRRSSALQATGEARGGSRGRDS